MPGEFEEPTRPLAIFYAYDQDDLELYSHAIKYSVVLWDIKQKLRSDYKYTELPEPVMEYIEKLRDFIGDLCNESHLPPD